MRSLHRRMFLAFWCSLGLHAAAGSAWAQPPHVRVVNAAAAPGGNGHTWANAFNDLQTALDAAAGQPSVDEIWVAAGTYVPSHATTSDPRSATFNLRNGLRIFGGFAGSEQVLEARNPNANLTVLSGGPLPVGPSNVYHVVTGSGTDASAVLDGFTVTGGNAARRLIPGPDSDLRGGGILVEAGGPTLAQLVITGNTAGSGGGAYISGTASLSDCTVASNNVAGVDVYPGQWAVGAGGGLFLSGSPTLSRVEITGNTANSGGGAYVMGNAAISGCRISANHVWHLTGANNGGGLFLSGEPQLTDCEVSRNTGHMQTFGGGVYGSGTFVRCTIAHNSSEGGFGIWGGGTYRDCQISDNRTGGDGYALYLNLQPAKFVGCTIARNGGGFAGDCILGGQFEDCSFFDNTGGGVAGSVVNGGSCVNCLFAGNQVSNFAPVLNGGPFINCTIAGNTAGPALIVSGAMTNCIVWGNASYHAPQPYSGTTNYCTMQSWDGSLGGVGNSGSDPLFANPGTGDYRVLANSPCIDSGNNNALPVGVFCDLDNHARFFDAPAPNTGNGTSPIVDRGAYEYGAPSCCYANCDASTIPPVLNVNDFVCFLNRFAAGHPQANCDASTTPPVLNVLDFTCFLNKFAAGCS